MKQWVECESGPLRQVKRITRPRHRYTRHTTGPLSAVQSDTNRRRLRVRIHESTNSLSIQHSRAGCHMTEQFHRFHRRSVSCVHSRVSQRGGAEKLLRTSPRRAENLRTPIPLQMTCRLPLRDGEENITCFRIPHQSHTQASVKTTNQHLTPLEDGNEIINPVGLKRKPHNSGEHQDYFCKMAV